MVNRENLCDENCNNCQIIMNKNSRMISYILNSLFDKFGNEVYRIVQKNCPNLTCCYNCHIDDFVHNNNCKITEKIDKDTETEEKERLEKVISYIDRLFTLKREDISKEIDSLCIDAGVNPKKYSVFLSTGGAGYVIDKLASDLFYSGRKIDDLIRLKISIFNIVIEDKNDVFYINTEIDREDNGYWFRGKKQEEKEETRKRVMEIVSKLLRRFGK